jgi:hypothetical protein
MANTNKSLASGQIAQTAGQFAVNEQNARHDQRHRALADPDSRGRDGRQKDAQRRSIERDAVEWANADLGDTQFAGLERYRWDVAGTEERWSVASRPFAAANDPPRSFWSDAEWIACADGKARRAKPGLRMLVTGMAGRTDLWRLAGNSINPILAAEVIKALKDTIAI